MAQIKLFENIFDSLKKMFSNDVIIRNVGGKKLKTIDTHSTQQIGSLATNYLNSRYANLYSTVQPGYNQSVTIQAQRLMLFRDYELMEQDPIISSALDLYAEEATVKNEFGEILTINSPDEDIKNIIHNLFYDILNIEFNLQHWIRNLVKYGDWFMKLEIAERLGIINVIPLSVYEVIREEGMDPTNPHYIKFKIDGASLLGGKVELEKYEMAHFRLLNDSNFLPYGKSMIEGSRRIWKQLTLMEDAMLIHRIMRAPQKRIFKIDVGNLHPNDVENYMKQIIANIKKVPYVDEKTGDYNLQYNMQNITEDFYLPIRAGESATSIDTLDGMEYHAIDDIEYLRNKLMASLRIPKAFLGYEESLSSKSTLSAEDIRFARTIERIQRIVISELTNIAVVHLFVQGYNGEDLVNFSLNLTSPSIIYEQEKLEMWTQKVALADSIKEQKLLSSDWIYDNIYNISESDRSKQRDLVAKDLKRWYRYQQILEAGNDPTKSGEHVDDSGTVRAVDQPDDIIVQGDGSENTPSDDGNIGRPKDSVNKRSTDKGNFGRDPIGKKDNKKGSNKLDKTTGLDFKGNSPLGVETLSSLSSLKKKYPDKYKHITILGENIELLNGNINDLLENENDDDC